MQLVLAPATVASVGRSRSQAMTRRVTPTTATTIATFPTTTSSSVEMHLPNGDLYIGSFSGSHPHGSGKCLWVTGPKWKIAGLFPRKGSSTSASCLPRIRFLESIKGYRGHRE